MVLFLHQILSGSILSLHGLHDLIARQFVPRGRNQHSLSIMLSEHRHSCIQLGLRDGIRAGQNNGRGSFNLIVVEFTEVLHVNLNLTGIHNSHGASQHHVLIGNLLHSRNNIGQLSHTGGLNHNPIRMVALNHLTQRLAEIAHQTAADAAGVHFGDVDAGILQKSTINANLTEFVLDQYQLLAAVSLLNHFLDQGCLAGSQEAGVNIDYSHDITPSVSNFRLIIPPFSILYK